MILEVGFGANLVLKILFVGSDPAGMKVIWMDLNWSLTWWLNRNFILIHQTYSIAVT